MEDRIRVLSIPHATLAKDDRDEVDTRAGQQRNRRGVSEQLEDTLVLATFEHWPNLTYSDIHMTYVADDIPLLIKHR